MLNVPKVLKKSLAMFDIYPKARVKLRYAVLFNSISPTPNDVLTPDVFHNKSIPGGSEVQHPNSGW